MGRSSLYRRVHLPLVLSAIIIVLISYLRFIATGTLALDMAFPSHLTAEIIGILFVGSVFLAAYGYWNASMHGTEWGMTLEKTIFLSKMLGVISFFSLPLLSNDIFIYLSCGQAPLLGIHPYTEPSALFHTVYHSYVPSIWADGPYCKYGPAAISLAHFAALIGGKSPFWGIFAWKVLVLAAFLLFCDAIGLLIRHFRSEEGNVAPFILLCPILWEQGPGQGHNDIFAVLFLTAALLLLAYQRYLLSILLLVLGLQVKFYILPLVALFFLAWWRTVGRTYRQIGHFCGGIVSAGLFMALLHYPYWDGWNTLTAIYGPLVAEDPMNNVSYLVPYGVVTLFPSLASLRSFFEMGIRVVLICGAGIISLWQIYRLIRGKDRMYLVFLRIMAFVVCFTSLRFHGWYLMVLLPLCAEGIPKAWLRWGTVVFPATLFFDLHNFLPRDSFVLLAFLPLAVVGVNVLFFVNLRERLTAH
mgnify:CR=1 FL=1